MPSGESGAHRGVHALINVVVKLLDGGSDDSRTPGGSSSHDELACSGVLDDGTADGRLGTLATGNKVDG